MSAVLNIDNLYLLSKYVQQRDKEASSTNIQVLDGFEPCTNGMLYHQVIVLVTNVMNSFWCLTDTKSKLIIQYTEIIVL